MEDKATCKFCSKLNTLKLNDMYTGNTAMKSHTFSYDPATITLVPGDIFYLLFEINNDHIDYFYNEYSIPISFCPFCGRNFEKWKGDGVG